MRTLEFTKNSTLAHIIESIKKVPEEELELIIPMESSVRKNPINLKIIEKVSSDLGKRIRIADDQASIGSETFSEPEREENQEEASIEEEEIFKEGIDVNQVPTDRFPQEQSSADQILPSAPSLAKGGFNIPSVPLKNLSSLKKFIPKIDFQRLGISRKFLLPIIIGGGLVVLLIFAYLYLPSAQIVLYADAKSIDREVQLNASTSVTDSDSTVPLKQLEVEQENKLTSSATGKKTIGEAAKGTVEIRNYDKNSQKVFDSGVKIRVQDGDKKGFEFTLDRAATVPTATTSRNNLLGREITDPGRVEVTVTASKIGQESNVSSGTLFSVANLNTTIVEAIATKDFTGGLSKEVTVVSSEDQRKAEDTLSKELFEKGEQALRENLQSDQKLPEGGTKNTIIKKTFDKDIDKEAKEFTLSMKTKSVANVYSEQDLKKVMFKSVNNVVPEGYVLDEEEAETEAEVLKSSNGEIRFLGKIQGNLIPKIDQDSLIRDLKGKSYSKAEEVLKGLANVNGYDIKASPTFPPPLARLPFRSSKISVDVTSR